MNVAPIYGIEPRLPPLRRESYAPLNLWPRRVAVSLIVGYLVVLYLANIGHSASAERPRTTAVQEVR